MDNRAVIYDIIYALAARDGREAALFGNSAPLAREAFARSLAGDAFPEVWFELPLAGSPWFDLHALTSAENLHPETRLSPDVTGGHPEVFEWFASRNSGVRQLALSWDTGSGNAESPAVQLLVKNDGHQATCEFLETMGQSDAARAYRAFRSRLPEGWFACYAGAFPQRPGGMARADGAAVGNPVPWVRIECIPAIQLQEAYAKDGELLATHLRQVGLSELDSSIVARCQLLARTPFQLEFQFDVGADGAAGAVFGASVRFAQPPGTDSHQAFIPDGAAGELMTQLEAWGLADNRWRLLAGTAFAKRLSRGSENRILYCYPAFVKLRWKSGEPLDAKAYLIAGAQESVEGGGR